MINLPSFFSYYIYFHIYILFFSSQHLLPGPMNNIFFFISLLFFYIHPSQRLLPGPQRASATAAETRIALCNAARIYGADYHYGALSAFHDVYTFMNIIQ